MSETLKRENSSLPHIIPHFGLFEKNFCGKSPKKVLDNTLTECYNESAKRRRSAARPHLQPCEEVEYRFGRAKRAAFDAGAVGIRNFLSCKWRCFTIGKLDHELNEDIRDKEVRLIDAQGVMVGIVTSAAALAMAEEQELDLVKISPNAVPPVCKIMDYGKYRFDQLKREKEAKKNQRVVEIKEIRMSPGIDTNDLNTKMRNACKFLTDGNRVKVTVRFRGREMAHTDIGEQLLIRFAEGCAEVSSLEKKPKLDGRHMSIFLSPKNAK